MALLARCEHFKMYMYIIDLKKERFMTFKDFKIKMILRESFPRLSSAVSVVVS